MVDIIRAEVGDGEGGAFDVVRLDLALTGTGDHGLVLGRDRADGSFVRISCDDVDQPFIQGDRYTHVDPLVAHDLVPVEVRVQIRELLQCQRGGLDDHVVDADLRAVFFQAVIELLAQRQQGFHIHFGGNVEVRNLLLGVHHAARDAAAQLAGGLNFHIRARRHGAKAGSGQGGRRGSGGGWSRGRSRDSGGCEAFHVTAHNAAIRARAFDLLEIHALVLGHAAGQRAGFHPAGQAIVHRFGGGYRSGCCGCN